MVSDVVITLEFDWKPLCGMEDNMINVTRLNGKKFVINCELIEFIEETPDTVITFTTGTKVIVRESADELVKEIKKYKKEIYGRDTCVVK